MPKNLIFNGIIVIDGQQKIDRGYVLFDEQGILEVGNDWSLPISKPDLVVYDAQGQWVTPGFCDVHSHGAVNVDFVSADNAEVNQVGNYLISEGVTSFLASTTVLDIQGMLDNAARLGTYTHQTGARCLGIHMEGPFMNPKYHAMMKVEWLRDANYEEYSQWQKVSNHKVKMITLAPECPGALDLIERISKETAVMVGHSDANVNQIHQAMLAGAKGFTHFYNAMSQHQHRNPGVVTAGFIEDSMMAELITDGMHVHPEVVKMTYQVMGPKRIILVSDAMPGKGMPDGKFFFCGEWVEKVNGITHLIGDTRIAGSIMPINQCARQLMDWTNCSINDIVQMVCVNPQILISEISCRGTLTVGKNSDLVVFDQQLKPLAVFVEGIRYQ